MFNVGNLPDSLYLLPAHSIHHSNCIAHIRNEVYARTQRIRLARSSKVEPDHVATYIISVETGSQLRAGTNANISISLTGIQFICSQRTLKVIHVYPVHRLFTTSSLAIVLDDIMEKKRDHA